MNVSGWVPVQLPIRHYQAASGGFDYWRQFETVTAGADDVSYASVAQMRVECFTAVLLNSRRSRCATWFRRFIGIAGLPKSAPHELRDEPCRYASHLDYA
jgi:hypothetical protein